MKTTKETAKNTTVKSDSKMGQFFGELYSFNTSLKLFHWHVTGKGSYAQHMALDQALEAVSDTLDRIVETTYAMKGDQNIIIPETRTPSNIVSHCENFFEYIDEKREMFKEDFSTAILDDYQEAIQQLLYRLKRLQ